MELSSGLGGSFVTAVAAVRGELNAHSKVQGSRLDTGSSSKGHSTGQASATFPVCQPALSLRLPAGPAEQDGWSGWRALLQLHVSFGKWPAPRGPKSSCIPASPPRYVLAEPASAAVSCWQRDRIWPPGWWYSCERG